MGIFPFSVLSSRKQNYKVLKAMSQNRNRHEMVSTVKGPVWKIKVTLAPALSAPPLMNEGKSKQWKIREILN